MAAARDRLARAREAKALLLARRHAEARRDLAQAAERSRKSADRLTAEYLALPDHSTDRAIALFNRTLAAQTLARSLERRLRETP